MYYGPATAEEAYLFLYFLKVIRKQIAGTQSRCISVIEIPNENAFDADRPVPRKPKLNGAGASLLRNREIKNMIEKYNSVVKTAPEKGSKRFKEL